jgi:hypothetical protein
MLISSSSKWNDVVIEPQQSLAQSRNLLPLSRFSRVEDFSSTSGGGSLAIAADSVTSMPDSRAVVFGSGGKAAWRSLSLAVGWHTLVIEGYTPVSDAIAYVQRDGSPFDNLVSSHLQGGP